MITLHILQLLQDNGFGTIDTDLFFEKLTLDKKGLYIVSRGSALSRGTRTVQAFDIYSRGENDLEGGEILEDVLQFLSDAYGTVCDLPTVPTMSDKEYKKVAIEPVSNVENVGLNANQRMIYVISGIVRYNI